MNTEIRELVSKITEYSSRLGEVRLMEVCGTHTHEIHRLGINRILPENIVTVSGPGCPVCVTDESDISAAMHIASIHDTIFCCYGDMLRVPCNGKSLDDLRSDGADVRIVLSSLDSLEIARNNPFRQVVFFGIGFETTAPATAVLIKKAAEENVRNISVLCTHKTMPKAITALLCGNNSINGLICPGHVAAITGSRAFDFVPDKLNIPAAVSGFEAKSILSAVSALCQMLCEGRNECVNMYPSVVGEYGNSLAQSCIGDVFRPSDAVWRGLGIIEGSGLEIREEFASFDALNRYEIPAFEGSKNNGCICASVIKGISTPMQCPNFGKSCTPVNPSGPCMVSSEGSCAAFYKYDFCREV